MHKTLIAVGLITIITALTGMAEAKGKKGGHAKPRQSPVVCLAYSEVKATDGSTFAVCQDGGKPKIFDEYSIVQIQDQDEGERLITVMVGWR